MQQRLLFESTSFVCIRLNMSPIWTLVIFLICCAYSSEQEALNLQPNIGDTGNSASDNCTCVSFFLCDNGKVITDGAGIIDIRINDGPCKNYLEICCKKEEQISEPTTTTPPPVPAPKGCGYRRPNGVVFQITGDKDHESQFGEFPWMVALLSNNTYQCGGSLIHPNVVVTAAHCVINKEKTFTIRAGEWDPQHINEPYPHQDREIKSIKIHPQFYSGALYNDIAFIVLESPVEITDNVDLICLPPQGSDMNAGQCYSTGWGKDVFGKEGKYQAILKRIQLPQVPRDICQEKLRSTRLGKDFELHKSFMCAGAELGKDACYGDGGSPLVCPIEGVENRYYQAGIVSWGIGCGMEGVPGVYVNLAIFRDWIDEQMKFNDLTPMSYQY